jgi:membrane protease YdiL (CAAX protease family)
MQFDARWVRFAPCWTIQGDTAFSYAFTDSSQRLMGVACWAGGSSICQISLKEEFARFLADPNIIWTIKNRVDLSTIFLFAITASFNIWPISVRRAWNIGAAFAWGGEDFVSRLWLHTSGTLLFQVIAEEMLVASILNRAPFTTSCPCSTPESIALAYARVMGRVPLS